MQLEGESDVLAEDDDGEDDDCDGDDVAEYNGNDDGDDDIYIMLQCLCVCLSRKMITSHFRALITFLTFQLSQL